MHTQVLEERKHQTADHRIHKWSKKWKHHDTKNRHILQRKSGLNLGNKIQGSAMPTVTSPLSQCRSLIPGPPSSGFQMPSLSQNNSHDCHFSKAYLSNEIWPSLNLEMVGTVKEGGIQIHWTWNITFHSFPWSGVAVGVGVHMQACLKTLTNLFFLPSNFGWVLSLSHVSKHGRPMNLLQLCRSLIWWMKGVFFLLRVEYLPQYLSTWLLVVVPHHVLPLYIHLMYM